MSGSKILLNVSKNTQLEICVFKEYNGAYGASYLLLDKNYDTYRAMHTLQNVYNNQHFVEFDHTSGIYYAKNYGFIVTCICGEYKACWPRTTLLKYSVNLMYNILI